MIREMRRKDRELKKEEAMEILDKTTYGILSTISEDGYPYGVPVNHIYFNDSIYFHCAVEGHKLDNIKNNDKVSFCVVGEAEVLPDKFSTKYESAIVFGRAMEVSDEEKNRAFLEILNKFTPDYIEEGKEYIEKRSNASKVIKICIEHISGKGRR